MEPMEPMEPCAPTRQVRHLDHASNVRAIVLWEASQAEGRGGVATFLASGGKRVSDTAHSLRIRAVDGPEAVAFWLQPPLVAVPKLLRILPPHVLLYQVGLASL